MSGRTFRILNLAQEKFTEDLHNESFSTIDTNLDVKNNIEEINLSSNFLLDEALTPENIADMIETAEIVFSDCGVQNAPSQLDEALRESLNYSMEETENRTKLDDCIAPERSSIILEEALGEALDSSIDETESRTKLDDCIEPEKSRSLEGALGQSLDFPMEEKEKGNREDDPDFIPYETDLASDSDDNSMDTEQELESSDNANPINPEEREREPIDLNLKKRKGIRKREINKKLRMSGKKYLGFRKPSGQKNTFHDTLRNERILGPRCKCIQKILKFEQKRKCYLITETNRKAIFNKFWSDLSWDQRKVFVAQSVTAVPTKRPTMTDCDEQSRRSNTLEYFLTVDNKRIPVCKIMYLNTIGIKEWSIRNWSLQSTNGLAAQSSVVLAERNSKRNNHEEDTLFLTNFLKSLNTLPSHYCRKHTDRLYLEQQFQSFAELHRAYSNICKENNRLPQSITSLQKIADDMKISLFRPRKDLCDLCFKYKNNNATEEEYQAHLRKKDEAREEKQRDKERAVEGQAHVITVDVQAVKLAPCLTASSLYYRTKLCNHNYTIYNLSNHKATCYWYDETNADGQAATYASFLFEYLQENFLQSGSKHPIVIYSDGCTAQNRNSIISNALLCLSEKYETIIYQKFLEKGHTQMECDSVHAVIERALKHKEIYLPSDYHRVTKEARLRDPYEVRTKPYQDFRNFGHKPLLKYKSIRPSNDFTVTDIRVLKYQKGEILYKINYSDDDYQVLQTRPSKVDLKNAIFPQLYNSRLPITKRKFLDLQEIKKVIPQDCWSFYDLLPYS